jgi:tape measure domain-containing protein
MAVVADRVIVELEAKLDRYDANVRRAEQTFANATGSIEKNAGLVTKATGAMGAALAGLSVAALAREFLRFADASKSIDAQLRLATRSFGTFAQAQADAERIAATTRNGLTETTSLYGNLLRATQQLGGTQDQASRATETFSKALKIGGADTAEAAAATLQFGQALASGVLRGDEFNSIAEASPRILQLLADALGVSRGAIRGLAEQGKLTSDVLFKSLTDRKFTAGIDDEFKTLPVTFGEAMQAVENAATITIGAFDRGGEFSTALANFVTDGAGGFESLGSKAEQFGADTRAVIAGLANVFDPLGTNGGAVFDALGVKVYSVTDQIRSLLGSIDKVYNFYADADNIGTRIENSVKRGLNRAIDRAGGGEHFQEKQLKGSNLLGNFDAGQRRSAAYSRREASVRRLEGQGYVVPRNRDGTVNEAGITRKVDKTFKPVSAQNADVQKLTTANSELRTLAKTATGPQLKTINAKIAKNNQIIANLNKGVSLGTATAAAGGGAGPKGKSAETLARAAESERQKALRNDEAYENEKEGLNRDLLRARAATTNAAEQVAAFEIQEIEAARVRQNDSYDSEVAQKKLTPARAKELQALNNQVAAQQKANVEAGERQRKASEAVALASADLQNQQDLADAQAALATTAKDRLASALRLLELQEREERARLDAVIASETSSANEKAIAQQRKDALPGIYGAKREAVQRDNEGPLASYARKLEKSPEDLQNDAQQLVVDELQHVQDGIANAISSKLGTKDPLITGLLNLFIEQVIMKPIANALAGAAGGAGGGGGGILGSVFKGIAGAAAGKVSFGSSSLGSALGSIFGGKRASGGHVNAGRVYQINDGGGTEGFQPSGSGKIIPLGRMNQAGGGGTTLHLSVAVDNRGSVNPEGFADDIAARVRRETVGIVTTAVKGVTKGVPGRIAQYQRDGV